MAKSSEIDFFQDHCVLIQYWLLSRPFGIYTVKLASGIDSFQDHGVYKQNWLISSPLQDYSSYFVKLTSFKTIQKRKLIILQVQNSKCDIWTHFRTIHEEIKKTQGTEDKDSSYLIVICTIVGTLCSAQTF